MQEGVAANGNGAIADGRIQTAGLILLFRKSDRPDRAAIRAVLSGVANAFVSFDPGDSQSSERTNWSSEHDGFAFGEANAWMELLVDGLTFDLVGLAPGPQVSGPPVEFRIDCSPDFELTDYEAIGLAPGPHLTGAGNSLVVAKVMAGLACRLAEGLGKVQGFYWLPSRSVTGPTFFISTVNAWIDGGPFPAIGLSAFRPDEGGGLRSVGLSFFTGQEVLLSPQLASDPASATRLTMRLVHQLALHGTLEDQEIITGPDGRKLELSPDEGGKLVRVRSI